MLRSLATGTKHFHKGETILAQGTDVEYLYLLRSGSCYRQLMTDKGDTVIYEIKEAGETIHSLIGVLAIYNIDQTSQFNYVARTDCECLCIPAGSFLSWASQKPHIQNQMLQLSLYYYEELRTTYQAHQEGRSANHLCRILLKCRNTRDPEIIEKKYSFSEMASMIGVHSVTVSRIIRCLCEEGVLEKEKEHLRIRSMDLLLCYASNKKHLPYK